jgi:putative SOS response-associated peptidase YedK
MAGWGLIPFWLKPDQLAKQPYSTINARSETIRTAPTYREPFKTKRCLVPATGWYEWQKLDAKKKRPIHMCSTGPKGLKMARIPRPPNEAPREPPPESKPTSFPPMPPPRKPPPGPPPPG